MTTPLKKVLIIVLLTLLCLYISLPKSIPVNLNFGPINFYHRFERSDLNITLGKFSLKRNFDLVLGLDLAGGSHLVFEAQTQDLDQFDREKAVNSVRAVIERRVNLFGVSEPNVAVSSFEGKDRIIVELPGIDDTQEAIGLIGKTA